MGQNGSRSVAALPPAVKVVHRGGHVERYYRTVTVDEVMKRNPRHFVAMPDLFQSSKPAVLAPEVVLMPGRKVLLVPYRTVASLRRKCGMSIPSAPRRSRVKISAAEEQVSVSVSVSVCPNAMRESRPGGVAGKDVGSAAAGKEGVGRREAAVPRRHKSRASCVGSPKVRASPRRTGGGRTPSRSRRMQGTQRGPAEEAVVVRRRVSPKVGGKPGCGLVDGKTKESLGKGGRESSAPVDQSSGVLLVKCAELPSPGLAGSKGSRMNKVFPVEDCQGQTCKGGDALQVSRADSDGQVPVYGRNGNLQSPRPECCIVQPSKSARADEQVIKGGTVSMNEVKDGSPVFGDEQVGQHLHEEKERESRVQNYRVQGGGLQGITNTAVVNGQVSSPLGNDGFDQDLIHYSSFVRSKIELFETLSQLSQFPISGKLGVLSPSPQALTTRVDLVNGTSLTQPLRDSLLDSVMDLASPRLTNSVAQVPKERSPDHPMSSAANLEEQQARGQGRHMAGRDNVDEGGGHEQDAQAECSLEHSLPIWQPYHGFSARPIREGRRVQDLILEPVREGKTLQGLILEPVLEGRTLQDLFVEPVRESKSLQDLILEDNQQNSLQPLDVLIPEKRKQEVKTKFEDTISRVPVECSPDLFEIGLDPFLLPEEQACLERRTLKLEPVTSMRDNIALPQRRQNTSQAPITGVEGSGGKSMPARKFAGEASNTPVVELQSPSQRSSGTPPRLKLRDHLKLGSPARETDSGHPSTEIPDGPFPMPTDATESPRGNQGENPGAARRKRKKPPGDSNMGYHLPKLPTCRRSRFRSWKPRLRTVIEGEVAMWSPIPHPYKACHGV